MGDFKQGDAMMLMWYECEKCGKKERIWNSRPRVTPFSVSCPEDDCKGLMNHKNWNNDEYAPNHWPEKGDRIFIDFSKEAAEKCYMKRIKDNWDNKDYPISKMAETKEEALVIFMENWSWGEPTITTI